LVVEKDTMAYHGQREKRNVEVQRQHRGAEDTMGQRRLFRDGEEERLPLIEGEVAACVGTLRRGGEEMEGVEGTPRMHVTQPGRVHFDPTVLQ
jgi:hypothetical protein